MDTESKLRHGQAMSMQWVGYLLRQVIADIDHGGANTINILKHARSVDSSTGLIPLKAGCTYVEQFFLAFAIELGLKALLLDEGVAPPFKHDLSYLYNTLTKDTKERLQTAMDSMAPTLDMSIFFQTHKDDFINWRYLENIELQETAPQELHLVICAILDVYNKNTVQHNNCPSG
ncbi:HEPN domain-containing protein [Oleidesulfovibrio sp.]|uniref:HEPN domain-containing protein n=1 Tax=Oleidesulfovibrio sp. TaxID=2909707 RepID=UPI003A87C855